MREKRGCILKRLSHVADNTKWQTKIWFQIVVGDCNMCLLSADSVLFTTRRRPHLELATGSLRIRMDKIHERYAGICDHANQIDGFTDRSYDDKGNSLQRESELPSELPH